MFNAEYRKILRGFKMKIAQIAPLAESVPPRLYGGTERIVAYLTDELVAQGHEVTLFASGDSHTMAHLVAGVPRALRLDPQIQMDIPHLLLMLDTVRQRVDQFDILHFHVDLIQLPLFENLREHTLSTLHGRLDIPDIWPFYRRYRNMPLVSISDAQRLPMPWVRWLGTVHHGLPIDLYQLGAGKGGYALFLGRISPEKGPDTAIKIACKAEIPLKIAAKVDKADINYFETIIKPLLNHPLVEYLGEVGESEKKQLLQNALALLFPIAWPEPFGLVMIEAMACGTPVICFSRGSVPEVMADGVTGHIVKDIAGAAKALTEIAQLDRRHIRLHFESRFTAKHMTQAYLQLYSQIQHTAFE